MKSELFTNSKSFICLTYFKCKLIILKTTSFYVDPLLMERKKELHSYRAFPGIKTMELSFLYFEGQ